MALFALGGSILLSIILAIIIGSYLESRYVKPLTNATREMSILAPVREILPYR